MQTTVNAYELLIVRDILKYQNAFLFCIGLFGIP